MTGNSFPPLSRPPQRTQSPALRKGAGGLPSSGDIIHYPHSGAAVDSADEASTLTAGASPPSSYAYRRSSKSALPQQLEGLLSPPSASTHRRPSEPSGGRRGAGPSLLTPGEAASALVQRGMEWGVGPLLLTQGEAAPPDLRLGRNGWERVASRAGVGQLKIASIVFLILCLCIVFLRQFPSFYRASSPPSSPFIDPQYLHDPRFTLSHLQSLTSTTWPPTWASSSAPTAPSATPPPTPRSPLLRPAASAPAALGRPPPRHLPTATLRTLRQATSAAKADGPSRCARHLPSSATEAAAKGVVDCSPCQRRGPRLVTDVRPREMRTYLLGKLLRQRRPQWPVERWASSERCARHSLGCV